MARRTPRGVPTLCAFECDLARTSGGDRVQQLVARAGRRQAIGRACRVCCFDLVWNELFSKCDQSYVREELVHRLAELELVEADDIRKLVAVHRDASCLGARAFIITPARDERGSNAVLCSPATAVPLRFGADSFWPHLAAARHCGIEPTVLHLPRIALDIDTPDDLALFLATPSHTRARALLETWRLRLTGEACNEARCR